MSMSAPVLAALMQTELVKLEVDPEAAALWSSLFDALAEAIVAHLTDNAQVITTTGSVTGETLR